MGIWSQLTCTKTDDAEITTLAEKARGIWSVAFENHTRDHKARRIHKGIKRLRAETNSSNEKLTDAELGEEKVELDAEGATTFRQVIGKCSFYCKSRVDMQYALKKLQADMSKPTKGSERRLKKFLRYMQGIKDYENRIEVTKEEFA